jgi:alanine dehydrogenase
MHDTPKPLSRMSPIMLPKEEVLEKQKKGKQLRIGIIKEEDRNETRVPLTPEGTQQLVDMGHEVFIENNAGIGSRFTPTDYSEAGAFVVDEKAKVFDVDILLKISPLNPSEVALLKPGQTLFSSLHLATREESYFRNLMQKRVTAIAFELLQDDYEEFPVLRSMCEIAGTFSVGIGSRYLSNYNDGKGILLGGITGVTPAEVLILGAGTAAEYAARTAFGMGADVKIFDFDMRRLQSMKHRLGREIFTSVLHAPVLKKAFGTADLVISTLQRLHRSRFYLVPEEMVMEMKKGSVIVDMHIDQGSSFETGRVTTPENPVYREHDVIHYMVPNMTAQVGRTASIAISNVLMPLLMDEARCGGIQNQILENYGVRQGMYLYNGILTQEFIGSYFGIPYKDLDLLLAAF